MSEKPAFVDKEPVRSGSPGSSPRSGRGSPRPSDRAGSPTSGPPRGRGVTPPPQIPRPRRSPSPSPHGSPRSGSPRAGSPRRSPATSPLPPLVRPGSPSGPRGKEVDPPPAHQRRPGSATRSRPGTSASTRGGDLEAQTQEPENDNKWVQLAKGMTPLQKLLLLIAFIIIFITVILVIVIIASQPWTDTGTCGSLQCD
eukprot:TRINITY_DN17552_c0_g1_i1.p1 TRINITY_DN17552_c0_g1~~TRINITY_DN17552_c0_g1_i1.p1  ORF type:complete len:198 (+),score=23.89 TRINITY_DN17552_c0_g1_i1:382-975(+)